MNDQPRGNWSSNMGLVLAATGSAIGLGNLWKFPFITWENNGGAFVLVYLVCIAGGRAADHAGRTAHRPPQPEERGRRAARVDPAVHVALDQRF